MVHVSAFRLVNARVEDLDVERIFSAAVSVAKFEMAEYRKKMKEIGDMKVSGFSHSLSAVVRAYECRDMAYTVMMPFRREFHRLAEMQNDRLADTRIRLTNGCS